jgi:hypothetical protein
VIGIYAASRLFTTALLAITYLVVTAAHGQVGDSIGTPAFPDFLTMWDSRFYREIAVSGYPARLPLDAAGNVTENPWAFLPVYPLLVRGLMVTGLDFSIAGPALSLLFGAGSAVVLYWMLEPRVGSHSALWAARLFCFAPLSFVLQTGYAESLFLFLFLVSVWMLAQQHYWLVLPFGLLAAFTRPGALALAAAVGIQLIVGLVRRDPVTARTRLAMIVSGGAILLAGFSWPVIAALVTGYRSAYFDTELAWWTGYVGRIHFVPMTPWFLLASRYLGWAGVMLVVGLVVAFLWWLTRPRMRAFGTGILTTLGAYGAYLVAVFLPQQSLFRVLLPLSPLLGDPAIARSPALRRGLLAASIALQPVAIVLLWIVIAP